MGVEDRLPLAGPAQRIQKQGPLPQAASRSRGSVHSSEQRAADGAMGTQSLYLPRLSPPSLLPHPPEGHFGMSSTIFCAPLEVLSWRLLRGDLERHNTIGKPS